MEIVKTNKGGNKICFNGHMYVIKHLGKNKITWRCMKASSLKCTGTMYTELQHDNPVEKNAHNHLPDPEEIKVTKCIQKMKDQVTSSSMINPVEIFAENVSEIETTTKARMPTEDTVKRMLRRQRSKNCPINSTIIEGNYKTKNY